MKANGAVSLLDLFELPNLQRELLLYLARNGPADAVSLAHATGLGLPEVNKALDVLAQKGRVRLLANGQVDGVMGKVKSRTTLPAQLWHALLSADRLCSEQDIATLRTAIPILQLARTRMIEFADHGPGHALRVKYFANQLSYLVGLDEVEQGLLPSAALFHDVGNIVDRATHNVSSQETVIRALLDVCNQSDLSR